MGHLFEDIGKRIRRDKMSKPPLDAEVQHQVWDRAGFGWQSFRADQVSELNHDVSGDGTPADDFWNLASWRLTMSIREERAKQGCGYRRVDGIQGRRRQRHVFGDGEDAVILSVSSIWISILLDDLEFGGRSQGTAVGQIRA